MRGTSHFGHNFYLISLFYLSLSLSQVFEKLELFYLSDCRAKINAPRLCFLPSTARMPQRCLCRAIRVPAQCNERPLKSSESAALSYLPAF